MVCAASRGLGRACAEALAHEGVLVTLTGRDADQLRRTAEEISVSAGVPVTIAIGDIATEAGRQTALDACASPDILVTNSGGPPLQRFADLGNEAWLAAVQSNMLAPIAMIRATYLGMRERKFGRIVNITSAYVKAPHAMLPLSVGPRAGLTAAVSWIARESCADNVTINNLLPEMILTDRARAGFETLAQQAGQSYEEFVAAWVASLPARRLGTPSEFGSVCAFLCSAQAGYVTNQNILIDGGHYPGVF
ncbi:SDR family oxidoreductase [Steroidobacter sp.]|uniref:SDR family oxidoreductase n=1 Tax=Steroidobacter sp. TaxID=1978227 RepID=UPI001A606006|nr:SDR family oxidoreductase [Steroidobacter sp.]MBL8267087.1 SDR family oxidoreductase [Steroidobacter sp.]